MRPATVALLLMSAWTWTVPAFGQDAQFTPPRLRVTTMPEKDAKQSGLKVSVVSPQGLGDKIGLKPGDIIKKIKVGEADKAKEWTIESPADLSRCLAKIRDATMNSKRAAPVTFEVQSRQSTKKISGAIIRAEVPDRIDGGTLYFFRPADKEVPRGGGK